MKSNLKNILLILPLLILIPVQLNGLDLSVGINTWYSWWDFDIDRDDESMEFEPAFLYGPIVSLKFADQWSISTVFLYGSYESKNSEGGDPDDIDRYDSDTSINYVINRYLKAFAGAKFMGFSFPAQDGDGTHRGYGPGAGIALTAPIGESLYFLFNISGLYLWTKHEQDGGSVDIVEKGINSTAAVAYYFPDISTSLTLGYRAQLVKMEVVDDHEYMDGSDMLFHGVTFSAVYSFDL